MIRDIVNYLEEVVGQMELPDDTSEEIWAAKLAVYAVAPLSQGELAARALNLTIGVRKAYCEDLMGRFKRANIEAGITAPQGLWMHHRMRAADISLGGLPLTLDILNMVVSGDVELGCVALQYVTPDDMTQTYHWLSSARLAWLVADMKVFLGWP